MNFPSQAKPAFWGAVCGATVLAIVGFTWGGWVQGSTAETMAKQRASAAATAALAPFCIDKFQGQADAATNLVELRKVSSWQRGSFIEKGGWATLPGSNSPNSAVATACAETLANGKVVAN